MMNTTALSNEQLMAYAPSIFAAEEPYRVHARMRVGKMTRSHWAVCWGTNSAGEDVWNVQLAKSSRSGTGHVFGDPVATYRFKYLAIHEKRRLDTARPARFESLEQSERTRTPQGEK